MDKKVKQKIEIRKQNALRSVYELNDTLGLLHLTEKEVEQTQHMMKQISRIIVVAADYQANANCGCSGCGCQ